MAAAAGGAAIAVTLSDGGGPDTVTTTVTETTTSTSVTTVEEAVGLPEAVAETRAALLEAAQAGDYEALADLLPDDGFSYTFGGPVEGGAIAYWQDLAASGETDPIDVLAQVLELPYALDRGYYVWPFAAEKAEDEMTPYERELLEPLGEAAYFGGGGYYGWRVGIEPDGTWRYFVAGD